MACKKGGCPGTSPGGLSTEKAVLVIKPTQPGFLNHTRKLLLIQRISIWKKVDLLPTKIVAASQTQPRERSQATLVGWRVGNNTEHGKTASTDKLG